jgi:hypothetical protein
VNMHSVGRVDSYNQFIKLVQEARLRNQGMTTGTGSVSATGAIGRKSIPQPYRPASPAASAAGVQGTSLELKAKTKILGSFFDSYA